jgi:hypothetical protein
MRFVPCSEDCPRQRSPKFRCNGFRLPPRRQKPCIGADERAIESGQVRELHDYFGDPAMSDADKLLRVTRQISNPKEAIRFIADFADSIQTDMQTKEMLKLFAHDELSSATRMVKSCDAELYEQSTQYIAVSLNVVRKGLTKFDPAVVRLSRFIQMAKAPPNDQL